MHDNERQDRGEQCGNDYRGVPSPDRRRFVKLLGAGVTVGSFGGTTVGSGAARPGDPTPPLHRDGNVMRDPSDNVVALHGVNVVDPRRANELAPWTKPIDELVELATNPDEGWNAQVIRLPVHPIDIADPADDYGELEPGNFSKERLKGYLKNHLDGAVEACEERGVYAIVDYHRHRTNDFTTTALDEEVRMFWKTVAPRYAEDEHVLYEVYNEPVGVNRGSYGQPSARDCWLRWRETAQPWVDIIQRNAPARPVIVGAPSWSQYTYLAPDNEFDGDNLMYAGHVYAHDFLRPLAESFGAPAEEVPVFMTEWGFDSTGGSEPYINGTVATEGQQFESFFEEHDHVHSTAWVLSHFWGPSMTVEQEGGSNYEKLTAFGQFVQGFLSSKADVHQPTAGETPTPSPPGDDLPPVGDGQPPTNLDSDDHYEDVTGDGTLDFNDLVAHYQHKDDPAMADHVAAYDYTDDGELDFNDLVALYQEMQS